jgi:hypothetical protein
MTLLQLPSFTLHPIDLPRHQSSRLFSSQSPDFQRQLQTRPRPQILNHHPTPVQHPDVLHRSRALPVRSAAALLVIPPERVTHNLYSLPPGRHRLPRLSRELNPQLGQLNRNGRLRV